MKPYYCEAGVTIYCGDCRDVLPQLGETFDLLVTDPPYGIGFAAQPTDYQRARGQQREAWDDSPVDCLPELLRYGRWCAVWGGNYYSMPLSRGWLCWYKPDAPPSMGSFELAWTNQDTNCRLISHSIAATNGERVGHPTQKPLRVMKWTLTQLPTSMTLIDPFAGSGTTLVAAKQFGMRAVGIEIEEKYCALAVKRLGQGVLDLAG